MDKEELKKIIIEVLEDRGDEIYNVLESSSSSGWTKVYSSIADNIISKILPDDDTLIKIIDKEQQFWD